jgi:Trk-type K+ transport system membrane component
MAPDYIIYLLLVIFIILGIVAHYIITKISKIRIFPKTWSEDKKTNYILVMPFLATFIIGYMVNAYVENYKAKDPDFNAIRGIQDEEIY